MFDLCVAIVVTELRSIVKVTLVSNNKVTRLYSDANIFLAELQLFKFFAMWIIITVVVKCNFEVKFLECCLAF